MGEIIPGSYLIFHKFILPSLTSDNIIPSIADKIDNFHLILQYFYLLQYTVYNFVLKKHTN